ncbi:hypothetical protein HDU96_006795 [Phlyctochytrium bullatum]|nr:hypothetical protein HDU96_006795 [Phlyctochytrium bullatum]
MGLHAHKEALKIAAKKHQLEILDHKDRERCIQLLLESFSDPPDPLAMWLTHVPGVPKEEAMARTEIVFEYILRLGAASIFDHGVVLGYRNEQGKLLGVMFCRVPGNPSMTTLELISAVFSVGLPPPYVKGWGSESVARFRSFEKCLNTTSREFAIARFNKNYWFVQAFGIVPEGRGKGLAKKFIKSVFEVADAQKVPVYLETEHEENEGLYKHYGFETLKLIDIASPACTEKKDIWLMARMPKK